MTEHLYFTCPIKALYMMKEFEVRICKKNQDISNWNLADLLCIDFGSKIYVAAESEHIFEPKYWDLGRCFKRNIIANFIDGKWENGTVKFDLKTTKIIMRNNIQFFMPEVENER